jgi:anaerobic magnesium-protoporphyrin IX monomethyl ester cyclase
MEVKSIKILLINPPRDQEVIGSNPEIIEKERGFNPPLGLLYIAAYLEVETSHMIEVIDAQVEQLTHEELINSVIKVKPDVVGLTAMTFTMLDVITVIRSVKKLCPKAIIVLGGPHVNLFPNETIKLPEVDYLVLGEGEEVFRDLVDQIENGNLDTLRQTKGIVFKYNNQLINTGSRKPIECLDRLPHPARHLTPYKKYSSLLSKGKIVTTLFTSRGCPFKCSFCDRPHLGKRFRARSADNVIEEIENCIELGIHEFLIYDDTFTINRKRVIEICNRIIQKKLDINFDIRSRIDTVDEEMLLLLKLAGCTGIHYGVEAGTDRVLKVLNKGITIAQVKEIFKLTHKIGIPTLAYFMIGNPTETEDEIRQTFIVAKLLNPDYLHLTILTPYPGTQVYAEALNKGIIESDVWREFAIEPTINFIPPYWGEHFSKIELQTFMVEGYRSFYLRPNYVMRRLFKIRSWVEFGNNLKAGLSVFKMSISDSFRND